MKLPNAAYTLALISILLLSACARPIADFTYNAPDQPVPSEVEFKNQSKNADQYEWDFGDGNKSTEAEPKHRYRLSGDYTVTLKAIKEGKSKTVGKKLNLKAPDKCLVEIETDMGNMIVWLFDATPQHRDNFIKLADEGYYDDLLFHRVINGFMIQGGDPNSRNAKPGTRLGMGGPGYQVPAEFVDSLVHIKGTLCAARNNNPQKKSSGSQFYLVQGKKFTASELDIYEARNDCRYSPEQRQAYMELGGTPQLDKNYTVFGKVIKGIEVIDKIATTPTDPSDRPKKDVKMKIRSIH